ncbi:MAG TPA: MBL fold metallo-hydrolase [Acidimicrobiales bacterium]|nr:MBL fold metallo-hydrolase [Acidimicrobiales bacterium]
MTGAPRSVDVADATGDAPLVVGEPARLSPLVQRVLAPNPSVMTGPGTNTYLIGSGDVTVIDPGPDDPTHVEAIIAAATRSGGRITRIVCTHTHSDHWPGAVDLAQRTGAEILAFDSRDGLEVTGTLGDGDEIVTADYTLRPLHTPGHASNHLCVLLVDEDFLFTGDHIMQGVTVVIAPPDGDMSAYMASLARLSALDPPLARIAPAHGYVLEDPAAIIEAYIAHRTARETIVADALAEADGAVTVDDLVSVVYADVDPAIHPIARLSLWAHLRKLADDGRATVDERDAIDTGLWAPV